MVKYTKVSEKSQGTTLEGLSGAHTNQPLPEEKSSDLLTPSEREQLRQEKIEASAYYQKVFSAIKPKSL